ncbi:MAG: membrane or secreted protein [Flavobacteriaceae bacterium]|nr:membrane or secreted protein [Flavobacteriaceae bacterium]
MFKLILLSTVLLGIGVLGIALKIWATKDGKFDGTCAGKNIRMKQEGIICGCGKQESCSTNLDSKITA